MRVGGPMDTLFGGGEGKSRWGDLEGEGVEDENEEEGETAALLRNQHRLRNEHRRSSVIACV